MRSLRRQILSSPVQSLSTSRKGLSVVEYFSKSLKIHAVGERRHTIQIMKTSFNAWNTDERKTSAAHASADAEFLGKKFRVMHEIHSDIEIEKRRGEIMFLA